MTSDSNGMHLLWISAYMEIGTINVSAVIAPYQAAIATATQKFGIPYFITSIPQVSDFRPYNIIAVFPDPAAILKITVEIVKRYSWEEVAVFYVNEEGM